MAGGRRTGAPTGQVPVRSPWSTLTPHRPQSRRMSGLRSRRRRCPDALQAATAEDFHNLPPEPPLSLAPSHLPPNLHPNQTSSTLTYRHTLLRIVSPSCTSLTILITMHVSWSSLSPHMRHRYHACILGTMYAGILQYMHPQ